MHLTCIERIIQRTGRLSEMKWIGEIDDEEETAFSAAGRRHVCRAADRLRRQFQRLGQDASASADASTSADSSAAGDAAASQEGGADSAELNLVEDGKLIMSTNAQFPPYEMVVGDGSFEGIDVEVAQAIAES